MWYFNIDASGNIWTLGVNNNSSITTVDVSPTSTPVNCPWEADSSGQYGVFMMVEWTQPGGLAAAAKSASTTQGTLALAAGTTAPAAATAAQQVIYVGDVAPPAPNAPMPHAVAQPYDPLLAF